MMAENIAQWQGVIIDEGFEKNDILSHVQVIETTASVLEGEEELGEFHFRKVQVSDQDLQDVESLATQTLRHSWYFHLVKGDVMKVFFKDKFFTFTKDDETGLKQAKTYAQSQDIHSDQIELEKLFEDPFA